MSNNDILVGPEGVEHGTTAIPEGNVRRDGICINTQVGARQRLREFAAEAALPLTPSFPVRDLVRDAGIPVRFREAWTSDM